MLIFRSHFQIIIIQAGSQMCIKLVKYTYVMIKIDTSITCILQTATMNFEIVNKKYTVFTCCDYLQNKSRHYAIAWDDWQTSLSDFYIDAFSRCFFMKIWKLLHMSHLYPRKSPSPWSQRGGQGTKKLVLIMLTHNKKSLPQKRHKEILPNAMQQGN